MSKSSTTTKPRPKDGMPPMHPGEFLKHELLEPLGLSANALAKAIGVPANRITSILNETRGVTAETAMLFAAYFGSSIEFWLNMQKLYEQRLAETDAKLRARVAKIAEARKTREAAAAR